MRAVWKSKTGTNIVRDVTIILYKNIIERVVVYVNI